MQEFRKLELGDKEKLEKLIVMVEDTLENKYFWLPISDESRDHFFDDEWTYFLGAFENNELIAAVGLFFNKHEYGESAKKLGISDGKTAEIGRAMVSPNHRRKGLMKVITEKLINYAKIHGIQFLVATSHPQNKPSQISLESLGMEKRAFCVKTQKYERDIFILEID